MIATRSQSGSLPRVYAFSSFFYPKIAQYGHHSVEMWTSNVDIFEYELLMIPVFIIDHWSLAVVDFIKKSISYYDSLGKGNIDCLLAVDKYLKEEFLIKKSVPLEMTNWNLTNLDNVPQQENGSDCGMFLLKFAEYVSRGEQLSFHQKDMPYFRRRIIWKIMSETIIFP